MTPTLKDMFLTKTARLARRAKDPLGAGKLVKMPELSAEELPGLEPVAHRLDPVPAN